MRLKTVFIAIVLILGIQIGHAQLAVIPYKIINSSVDFPETIGGEYSRLLSVAAYIAKDGIEIVSSRDIDLELEKMKIQPQEVITKDDLNLLGKTRYIDYFLAGSLTKIGKAYRSESIFYSVRSGKIIMRIRVEDEDLFRLAEREIKDALVQYKNRKLSNGVSGSGMDIVFLLDMSYKINHDWDSIKNAVIAFSSDSIDSRRIDTRVYLVPFSEGSVPSNASVSINSIPSLRKELDNLKPTGVSHTENFIRSLRYAVQNVKWRAPAHKMIIIITNSSLSPGMAETYALMAHNRGISIHAISLGQIAGEQCEVYDRLSSIADGVHAHAAYHQKIYDAKAEPTELYLENGRLFKSQVPDGRWLNGLYEGRRYAGTGGKPKSFLEEIHYSDNKVPVNPQTMAEAYGRITMGKIINQEKLENNIEELLAGMAQAGGKIKPVNRISGKALVSDGRISFWIYTSDGRIMSFLESSQKSGHTILLGVTIKRDPNATYGLTLVPQVTELGPGYIPDLLKARLSDIIQQSDYYLNKGLFHPPVWFVSVRVDTVERSKGVKDIRQR